MEKTCSFYIGLGKAGLEGLGTSTRRGWDQAVLDAASRGDYLHKVLQSIDVAPPDTWHDSDCAFTWFDSQVWVRLGGKWVVADDEVRQQLPGVSLKRKKKG